jgi:hypothetical protein
VYRYLLGRFKECNKTINKWNLESCLMKFELMFVKKLDFGYFYIIGGHIV